MKGVRELSFETATATVGYVRFNSGKPLWKTPPTKHEKKKRFSPASSASFTATSFEHASSRPPVNTRPSAVAAAALDTLSNSCSPTSATRKLSPSSATCRSPSPFHASLKIFSVVRSEAAAPEQLTSRCKIESLTDMTIRTGTPRNSPSPVESPPPHFDVESSVSRRSSRACDQSGYGTRDGIVGNENGSTN